MPSQSDKPTIVIATSSFTLPHFYTTFIEQLKAHGYDAVAVEYPSVGETPATMTDDAAAIRKVTMKLVDDGKDVVLIMHSYGGIPGTDSAVGLGKKERAEGGIVALVYVTAFMIAPGQSMVSASGADDGGGGGMKDYVAFEVSAEDVFFQMTLSRCNRTSDIASALLHKT